MMLLLKQKWIDNIPYFKPLLCFKNRPEFKMSHSLVSSMEGGGKRELTGCFPPGFSVFCDSQTPKNCLRLGRSINLTILAIVIANSSRSKIVKF